MLGTVAIFLDVALAFVVTPFGLVEGRTVARFPPVVITSIVGAVLAVRPSTLFAPNSTDSMSSTDPGTRVMREWAV